jgi:hypothetical protein
MLQDEKPVDYEGQPCFYYKGMVEVVDPLSALGETNNIMHQAWIDAETRRPVALDNGVYLGKFTFAPLSGTLAMPDKFKQKLDYYKIFMGM